VLDVASLADAAASLPGVAAAVSDLFSCSSTGRIDWWR